MSSLEVFNRAAIVFMIASLVWVIRDARRRNIPWKETVVWGVFAGWFILFGLAVYLAWTRWPRKNK